MDYKEIQILKDRIIEDAIDSIDSRAAMEYCCSMTSNGSWNDVDYNSQAWANWSLRIHFRRIREMSCAYADTKSKYHKSTILKKAIHSATDFWMSRTWSNPNWWNTEMLPQQEMRYVALLMGEDLEIRQKEFIIGILQDMVEESWTGANRIWFSENVIFKGILTENEKLIRYAAEKIMSTAKCGWNELVASEDGIQPDGSFTQHGRLLYNNGYGAAWLDSISFWIYQMRGLSIDIGEESYDIAVSMLLDGTMWMQHKGVIDPGTCGREISRKRFGTDIRIGKAVHRLLETARTENLSRIEELYAVEQYLRNKKDTLPDGNKMFWRVDYMSHRRHHFMATVKMLSKGVKGSESILNENKLGGFLSYGMTVFMRHGMEYFGKGCEDGIFSVMDWTHISGVSAPAIEVSANDTNKIDTLFAGGVTDGYSGAATMEYEQTIAKPSITPNSQIRFGGKKAYFFFDEGVVVLGAGLHCDSEVFQFDTTVNQSRFCGYSCFDGDKDGEIKICRTGRWINHDATGYVFFEPVEYCLEQGSVMGTWDRITSSYPKDCGKSTMQNIFKLYICHGINVENKTCAYMVLPGQNENDTLRTVINSPVRILCNDIDLQAVYFTYEKMVCLIFYKEGKCNIHENFSVSVDGRCMLMMKEVGSGIKAYVSNPETTGFKLHIQWEYHQEKTEKTVIFPKGESFLGKTIEII